MSTAYASTITDTDIHKAENPNLHAHLPFPALVHKARIVKKPCDVNGQTWTPKEIRDAKIEITGEAEVIEFQNKRVENAEEHALDLKRGWFSTPKDAEAYAQAKAAKAAREQV